MPSFTHAPARLTAPLPDGVRIYAIGDVHGCDDRLAALHALIAADLADRPTAAATLVHLGDYIDRGPDSAAVLSRIVGPPPAPGLRVVNLAGNHEEMLRAVLDGGTNVGGPNGSVSNAGGPSGGGPSGGGPDAADHWLSNGGAATLASWHIPPATPARDWPARIPPEVRATLASLQPVHRVGGYLFVHAGVRPGIPLHRQDPHDLIWIRQPFLSSDLDFGAVVVHGHTPRPAPEVRMNRIGIDTGAVTGGALTCVVLEADRMAFVSA